MTFATKEEIEEIFEKIKKDIDEKKLIILVEGKKDRVALEYFGFTSIIVLHGKDLWNRLEKTVEENPGKEALILTDFDKEGKELYGKLHKHLERLGAKVNKQYREFFQKRTKLSHVEGLVSYVGNVDNG